MAFKPLDKNALLTKLFSLIDTLKEAALDLDSNQDRPDVNRFLANLELDLVLKLAQSHRLRRT